MSIWRIIQLIIDLFNDLPKRVDMLMDDQAEGVDLLIESEEEIEPAVQYSSKRMYIIDCGHGPATKGKRSPDPGDGSGAFLEYKFNHFIGKMLYNELRDRRVKCAYSIHPDSIVGDDLFDRVHEANSIYAAVPKFFVSIHSNMAPVPDMLRDWTPVGGIETWHYYGNSKTYDLAAVFQKHLVEELGWRDRGVRSKKEKQFYVLRETNHDAILLEIGFYNNLEQMKELRKSGVRKRIVEALVRSIMELENRAHDK